MLQLAYWFCVCAVLAACIGCRRPAATADKGKVQFQNYCAACHRYDGQEMGDGPQLYASRWVRGPEDGLIRIVLHGLRGRLEMPGFGQVLSDEDAASLLSYVRARFGPEAEPIKAEAVGRVRAAHRTRTDYWSLEELRRLP